MTATGREILTNVPDAFIFMKVGQHAGETFDTILTRKNQEFHDTGMVFWGYGGASCHPLRQVQPFARVQTEARGNIYLLMQPINSNADPDIQPATEYSEDGIAWKPIPQGIEVLGSRYALVLGEIQPGDLEINMDEYAVGIGPSRGRRATDYLKGRVDKACLLRRSGPMASNDAKQIGYSAPLKSPYAVLLR